MAQMQRMWLVLELPVLWSFINLLYFTCCWAEGSTAFVSKSPDGVSFLQALQDPRVSAVVINSSDYAVGHEFDPFIGKGVPINRNVTVSGSKGLDTILDLQFVRSAVDLCSSCRWTFNNITIENDRRGTGGYLDFFLGQPGSTVLLDNVLRVRPACTAARDTAVVVNETRRSKYFPNPDGPQQFTYVNISYKGVQYQDQLYLIDYTMDDPKRVQEGRGLMGGVGVKNTNTTRICRFLADPQCLKTKSSDACVNDKVDQVLAEEEAAAAGKAGQAGGASPQTAAIAAGVAVAGVVLVAALALGLLWRHRSQQRQLQYLKRSSTRSDGGSGYGGDSDIEKGLSSSCVEDGPRGKGWLITSTLTTPLMQPQQAEKIKLGELLGAGSFGRVYKAIWAGREVAVKVIEHDCGSTEAVEHEVQMMLSFNHPNIVRAFHSVTYTKQHSVSSTCPSSANFNANSPANSPTPVAVSAVAGTPTSCTAQSSCANKQQERRPTDSANSNVNLPLQQQCAVIDVNDVISERPTAHDDQAAAETYSAAASAAGRAETTPVQNKSSPTPKSMTKSGRGAVASAGEHVSEGSGAAVNTVQSSMGTGSGGAWHIQGPAKVETWLVQEYCDVGTLSNVMAQWCPDQEEDVEQHMLHRLLLLLDAAQGLQVLHSQNVVHADLNARNVLVASSAVSPTGMVAKLADLGLSRVIKQHKTHRTTQTVGTMSHMPPELLRYGRMSAAVDCYAFGIMMWETFTGQAAFKKLHYGQFYEAIVLQNLRPLIPATMPADYRLLMEHCWATDPAQRPSMVRVVECLKFMVAERQVPHPEGQTGTAESPEGGRVHIPPDLLNTPAPMRQTSAAAAAATAAAAAKAAQAAGSLDGAVDDGFDARLTYDEGAGLELGCMVVDEDGSGNYNSFNALASGTPAKVPGDLPMLPQSNVQDCQWFV